MAIRLDDDSIEFHFPEVDRAARMRVTFHRTARVPDDGHEYGLPAGFGRFPLRRVADLPEAPQSWARTGGVVMPMWQSEACWLSFDVEDDYPFPRQGRLWWRQCGYRWIVVSGTGFRD